MSKKRFDHRHIIVWIFFIGVAAWSFFICKNSYIRLYESVIALGTSFVFALFFIYDWCPAPRSVNEASIVTVEAFLPDNFSDMGYNLKLYFDTVFDRDNFVEYLSSSSESSTVILQLLLYGLLVFAVCFLYFKVIKKPTVNNDTGKDTFMLRLFKKYELKIEKPVIAYIRGVFDFFVSRKYYFIPSAIVFLLSTNIVSIVFSVLAYYFYVLGSLDLLSFAFQLYKLSIDLAVLLSSLPLVVWIVIILVILDLVSKSIGYNILQMFEGRNKLFLRERGSNVYINGAPGVGKTSTGADMLLSEAAIIREDSLKLMLDIKHAFPQFPFQVLIKYLDQKFEKSELNKKILIKRFFKKLRAGYEKTKDANKYLFGYDTERYPITFDNGLIVESVFDAACDFAVAYLMYSDSNVIISVIPVRDPAQRATYGNLLVWNHNYFKMKAFDRADGNFSKILNWDMVRPGKKYNEKDHSFGVIEFGAGFFPEIDKERGNNLENLETKASEDECNVKNDLFERYLMMRRHAETLRYVNFGRDFFDSQRETGWGAKGNELADHINIIAESENRIALPGFLYRDMLYDWFVGFYNGFIFKKWIHRGDNTLRVYLLDKLILPYINYCERLKNVFGYKVKKLTVERGDGKGSLDEHKWYQMKKKVFCDVYPTDSFYSYFGAMSAQTKTAFRDLERYQGLYPELDELKLQRSNFVNSFLLHSEKKRTKK